MKNWLTNLYTRFTLWLNRDSVKSNWDACAECNKIVEVRLTFPNGLVRTLSGKEAAEWHKDLYFAACGRRSDWKRHKWVESWKNVS